MISSTHRHDPITPTELNMLHGVFHSICRDRSIESQSEEGSSMALRLLARFQAGARDEQSLFAAMQDA